MALRVPEQEVGVGVRGLPGMGPSSPDTRGPVGTSPVTDGVMHKSPLCTTGGSSGRCLGIPVPLSFFLFRSPVFCRKGQS